MEFYGLEFNTNEHKPTDKKIHDIQLMPEPKDIIELQSFLGMINYLNKYSPSLTELTTSLCDLTNENVPFISEPEHTKAFHAAKKEIQHTPLLAYFDHRKPTVLQMDALGYGLGAVIIQNTQCI